MISKTALERLIDYIDENIRSSNATDIPFIDDHNYRGRLKNKQNHVLFGRRGTGKTILSNSLEDIIEENTLFVRVNMEDYKGMIYPNILIAVIKKVFEITRKRIKKYSNIRFYQVKKVFRKFRLQFKLDVEIKKLEQDFSKPEEYLEVFETVSTESQEGEIGGEGAYQKALKIFAKTRYSKIKSRNIKEKYTLTKKKIDDINESVPRLKELIHELFKFYQIRALYLILDDFYFVKLSDQAIVIDYFNKLSKDLSIYIKIASIRNKSWLYREIKESYFGMQIDHDIHEIDLDRRLNNINELRLFYTKLLNSMINQIQGEFKVSDLITSDAFILLCVGSGGVPRDFLSSFRELLIGKTEVVSKMKINKDMVDETLRGIYQKRISRLNQERDDATLLYERGFRFIEKIVLEKSKINSFLISNTEIKKYHLVEDVIKNLTDRKLVNLIEDDFDRYDDTDRYSVYLIDQGCTSLYNINRGVNPIQNKLTNKLSWSNGDLKKSTKISLKSFSEYLEEISNS